MSVHVPRSIFFQSPMDRCMYALKEVVVQDGTEINKTWVFPTDK